MKILSNNEIDRTTWAEFVKAHPKGNVFQTPEMYDVYTQTPGYTPQVIALAQDRKMVGLMMWVVMQEKGIIARFSMRSIIQGAPLVKDDKLEYIAAILEAYEQMRDRKVIYTQIRNHSEMLTANDAFQQCEFRFKSHLNFIITLDEEEVVWSRVGKGRIKQIKKAQKNGLYVDVFEPGQITDELINNGYCIIRSVYLRAGLPLTDIEQIRAANKQGILIIFVVRDAEGTMLGCRFGLLFRNSIYGWYAGSYIQYYSLFPNDLLIWETLRWGIKNGYEIFDYGGAGEPNKPYGVRTFKQQMGGELVNFGRYEKIHRKVMYIIGEIGVKLLKIFK
ncbi:MAG: lipid II:glycine glycyltransferase FemX [Paludibacteraceae bacterium]